MTKRETLPVYFPDESALVRMRDFLNGREVVWRRTDGGDEGYRERMDDADWRELRTLVDDWLGAGKNWQRFIAARLKAHRPVDFVNGTFNIPTNAPCPLLVPYPAKQSAFQHAYGVFTQFVLHPKRAQLDGPCRRKGCGRFFLRETAHQKVYCTARCASRDSAVLAMRRKRQAQKDERKEAVTAAIAKYTHNRKQGDWRVYVETETGVTSRTLGGWVKTGFIKAPAKSKTTR